MSSEKTSGDDKSKPKCANCGHDVTIYHHPLGSSPLVFHDNGGAFGSACDCGCKNPKIKVEKK